jgi:hypothetical protein
MSLETVLAQELHRERDRNSTLEYEIMQIRSELKAFEESRHYPPNINACIRDVRAFLGLDVKEK